ncbi:hypothetical protein [Spirochaeta cellobiosiphila]|uniref:hypothetical protein n=1 Tax=Spirochaeta cellobiosiphila TaxID=504483 RepID=UPI000425D8A5|nr:hypothetical protein [Spirochaeta cellobiosiphila]
MYVESNKRTGEISISLPTGAQGREQEVQQLLFQEFAYEDINKSTVDKMNQFLTKWFKEQGIEILEGEA